MKCRYMARRAGIGIRSNLFGIEYIEDTGNGMTSKIGNDPDMTHGLCVANMRARGVFENKTDNIGSDLIQRRHPGSFIPFLTALAST